MPDLRRTAEDPVTIDRGKWTSDRPGKPWHDRLAGRVGFRPPADLCEQVERMGLGDWSDGGPTLRSIHRRAAASWRAAVRWDEYMRGQLNAPAPAKAKRRGKGKSAKYRAQGESPEEALLRSIFRDRIVIRRRPGCPEVRIRVSWRAWAAWEGDSR